MKKIVNLAKNILSLFYKENGVYRILFGSNRGIKLRYTKDVNYKAILGMWEQDSCNTLKKLFKHYKVKEKSNIGIYDIGANIGFYALFFWKYTNKNAEIYSYEPGEISEMLNDNLRLNSVQNVKLIKKACSDSNENVEFHSGHHHKSSLIKQNAIYEGFELKTMTVKACTLDVEIENFQYEKPFLIKIDIEGGGVYALPGMYATIKNHRPFIIIESHTAEEDLAIIRVLNDFNYEGFRIDDNKWVLNKNRDHKDPNGVWGTILLVPNEKKSSLEKVF